MQQEMKLRTTVIIQTATSLGRIGETNDNLGINSATTTAYINKIHNMTKSTTE